jgi:membrane-associated phospholipid phosphatase
MKYFLLYILDSFLIKNKNNFIKLAVCIAVFLAGFYVSTGIKMQKTIADFAKYYTQPTCAQNDTCVANAVESGTVIVREIIVAAPFLAGIVTADLAYLGSYSAAMFSAYTIVGILKESITRERPNKKNNKSFPSGHANAFMLVAAFIMLKHGLLASLPFYLFTIWCSCQRIATHYHYFTDVLAGIIIAAVSVMYGEKLLKKATIYAKDKIIRYCK